MTWEEAEENRKGREEEVDEEFGQEFLIFFEPGRLGFHELADRSKLAISLLDETLLNHPALVKNPEFFHKVWNAMDTLNTISSEICEAHARSAGVEGMDDEEEPFKNPFDN